MYSAELFEFSLFDTVLYLSGFFKSQPPYQLFIGINSFNGFGSRGVTPFHGRINVFPELTFSKDDELFQLALRTLAEDIRLFIPVRFKI